MSLIYFFLFEKWEGENENVRLNCFRSMIYSFYMKRKGFFPSTHRLSSSGNVDKAIEAKNDSHNEDDKLFIAHLLLVLYF